jgi:hypothetical protein
MRTRTDPAADRPHDEVITWRRDRLTAAGFDPALAAEVAADPQWDLHATLELVERGCPPRLAVRILAPLEARGTGS